MTMLQLLCRRAACLLCALSAGYAPGATAAAEDEPHLVFRKTVTVRDYAGGQAYAAPYSIKKGEHLWKIMREHYQMDDSQIARYMRIARAVNPEVADLNMLEPHQQILVPYKFIPAGAADNATVVYPDQDVTVIVAEGEHLGRLLRTRYRLPDSVIFSPRTYRLIARANPGIDNPDLLEEGQALVIPSELFAFAGGAAAGQPAAPDRVMRPPVPGTAVSEHGPPATFGRLPGPRAAAAAEQRARSALSTLAGAFDGGALTSGQMVLALSERGSVNIDYAAFPVYHFPWGTKIMLDYGGRLPEALRQVIASERDAFHIVTVGEQDDLEAVLERAISAAGFFQVERQADYFARQGPVQVGVYGDWIIGRDRMMKHISVVTLVNPGQDTLRPELKRYLAGMGLHLVDIAADGASAPAPPPGELPAEAASPPLSPADGAGYLADLILNAAGISYVEDATTDIFQNMYSGLSMEITLDRMFVKNGISHGINFHVLPETIVDIIRRQGLQLLQLDGVRADAADSAADIARFCGIELQPSPVVIRIARGDKPGVTLSVPGTLIAVGSGNILIAKSDLEREIADVLRAEGIQTLKPW